jgi:hypothetical protein
MNITAHNTAAMIAACTTSITTSETDDWMAGASLRAAASRMKCRPARSIVHALRRLYRVLVSAESPGRLSGIREGSLIFPADSHSQSRPARSGAIS